MEKKIDFQGFTKAIIKILYENDSVLCDLVEEQVVEVAEITGGQVTEVRRESNISFDRESYPFELSDEDILELRPIKIEQP
jgi:hypothetical protein